jgi:hypothetical protein
MMPQHLLNVSAANAKLRFGVVIADNPPFADGEATQTPAQQRIIVKTGGNVPPLFPEIQPEDQEPVTEEPPQKNGDLF